MNTKRVAEDIFEILQTYGYTLIMYDSEGNRVFEPSDGMRFFAKAKNILISIDDDTNYPDIRCFLGKNVNVESIKGMLDSLRTSANKYGMIFTVKVRDSNISPKDFSTLYSIRENRIINMKIVEGMYGTSRSSYLKLEHARMIVRHSARINENSIGARGKNICAIFIENESGERYLMPTNKLAPARAMVNHVNNGGLWGDSIGQYISNMACDFANLGTAVKYLSSNNSDIDNGIAISETVKNSMKQLREMFHHLCVPSKYKVFCENINNGKIMINEDSDAFSHKVAFFEEKFKNCKDKLDKKIIESLARIVEYETENNIEYVGVLNHKVSKEAWEDLKKGILKLSSPIDNQSRPNLERMHPIDRLSYYLSEIAEKCVDNSMANLLSYVSDELQRTTNKELFEKLKNLASIVLKKANISSSPEIIKTESISKLFDWVDHYDADIFLKEGIFDPTTTDAAKREIAMNRRDDYIWDAVNDFDLDDFMSKETLPDEMGSAELRSYLYSYLENSIADWDGVEINIVDTDVDLSEFVENVSNQLRAKGYDVEEYHDLVEFEEFDEPAFSEDDEEDLELAQEDILIPHDQSANLIDDVSAHTIVDPCDGKEKVPDDDYFSRLQDLAGIQATNRSGYY